MPRPQHAAASRLRSLLASRREGRAAAWPGQALAFARLVVQKSGRDAITLKAAALAFVTILSLIPLLAAFSFVATQLLDEYRDRVLRVLTDVLPYTEASLLERIQQFVAQAESLREFGTLMFVLVGLGAFVTIEETVNKIWVVDSRRTLRAKLLSFTLLVFWGPLLIGSSLSFLLVLRQRPGFDVLFAESLLVQGLPFLVSFFGLTMLYWQVPNTYVRFRAAAAGGFAAALLLELLRRTFVLYVASLTQFSYVVYGSFALAIFFMVSVQLAWLAVLLGCEVAYVTQHFASLLQAPRLDRRFRSPWVGLAALLCLASGLRRGKPLADVDRLAGSLGLSPENLRDSLHPLEEAGLVASARGESDAYLLARDAHTVTVAEVLAAYDPPTDELVDGLPESVADAVRPLLAGVRECRDRGFGQRRLADLVAAPPEERIASGGEGEA